MTLVRKYGIEFEVDSTEASVLLDARLTIGQTKSPCMMQAIADVKSVFPGARIVEVKKP